MSIITTDQKKAAEAPQEQPASEATEAPQEQPEAQQEQPADELREVQPTEMERIAHALERIALVLENGVKFL